MNKFTTFLDKADINPRATSARSLNMSPVAKDAAVFLNEYA